MSSWQNIATPVVLLLTGLILIAGDSIGVLSLDSIPNLWPVAFIAVAMLEIPAERKG